MITKKQKEKIKSLFIALQRDVSYTYGGWLYIFIKLAWNAVLMWIFFGFLQSWYYFVMKSYYIDEKDIKTFRTILWCIGMVWVLIIGFSSKKDKERTIKYK
jgi:hypothetical protein